MDTQTVPYQPGVLLGSKLTFLMAGQGLSQIFKLVLSTSEKITV